MSQTLYGVDAVLSTGCGQLNPAARVGLLTNHTGRSRAGVPASHILDAAGLRVECLFTPEHGLHGKAEGPVASTTAGPRPVHSLYGEAARPEPSMLRGLDALVCDLQDVGARFYTYGTTLAYCMESAALAGVPVVVLDRPNPLGGLLVEGPLLEPACESFVGHVRVPVVHGLTLGELAQWHALERRLEVDLHVVPVQGWSRSMLWPQTGLQWPVPSPNLPDFLSAAWYPGICLLEFCDVSVGRGTPWPFQFVGAPWLCPEAVVQAAASLVPLRDIKLQPVQVVPERGEHQGVRCAGVRLSMRDPALPPWPPQPVAVGLALLLALARSHPEVFNEQSLRAARALLGSDAVLQALVDDDLGQALDIGRRDSELFMEQRRPALIYPS